MTSLTDTQVVTASGGLVELGYTEGTGGGNITATSTPGDDLGVDTTVVCDGSPILIEFFSPGARPDIGAAGRRIYFELVEDGTTLYSQWGLSINDAAGDDTKPLNLKLRKAPSAGSHTYKVRAWVSAGTGFVGNGGGKGPMFLRVSKIVQATQWPAVTTGTIICTSSTRPASPFEGQQIYETDTDLAYTYNGSAWVQTGDSTGAWVSFTPSWSNLTVGNATNVGSYYKSGRLVVVRFNLVWGSTTSASGQTYLNLPVTAATPYSGSTPVGLIYLEDSGVNAYSGRVEQISTTQVQFVVDRADATYLTRNSVSNTTPYTWATNDILRGTFTYESAA